MTHLPAAEQTQLTHAADADGWCGFHLRHFGLRIPAGTCASFQLAAEAIRARRSSQRIRVVYTRPPSRD